MIEYLIDHLGLFVWLFVIIIAVIDLRTNKLKKWPRGILLTIGVLGVLIDGSFLLNFWLNLKFMYAWVFDFFGVAVFVFIIWLSFGDFKNKKISRHYLTKVTLLVIGILGLMADSFVLAYYLL